MGNGKDRTGFKVVLDSICTRIIRTDLMIVPSPNTLATECHGSYIDICFGCSVEDIQRILDLRSSKLRISGYGIRQATRRQGRQVVTCRRGVYGNTFSLLN